MSSLLAILFALVSVNLNALSAVMQRHATGQVHPSDLFRRRILTKVMRNRLWLGGVGLQVAGFFAQALALHSGSLVLVQPLLITDVIFLLVYLHIFMKAKVGLQGYLGVGLLVAGLTALLVVAQPQSGVRQADTLAWILVVVLVGCIIALAAYIMRRLHNVPLRSLAAGFAAGLHFAFTAALTKLVLLQLHHGVWHTLFSWPLLGLIVFGVSSAITMQSMYGAGPLAITQPALEITEACAGIEFGILLFGDSIHTSILALAAESFSGLVAAAGLILLARNPALRQQTNHALD
jgi:drug/metabolite transporter (DMT)-like permease